MAMTEASAIFRKKAHHQGYPQPAFFMALIFMLILILIGNRIHQKA